MSARRSACSWVVEKLAFQKLHHLLGEGDGVVRRRAVRGHRIGLGRRTHAPDHFPAAQPMSTGGLGRVRGPLGLIACRPVSIGVSPCRGVPQVSAGARAGRTPGKDEPQASAV